jgi:hypothetical protein
MSSRSAGSPLFIYEEIELIAKDQYMSMLQAADISSALLKILDKKVGTSLKGYLEAKRPSIDELIRYVEKIYIKRLANLNSMDNKYVETMIEISNAANAYAMLSCLSAKGKPCYLFMSPGLYESWLERGEEEAMRLLRANSLYYALLEKVEKEKAIELKDLAFQLKPVWEKVSVHASFPARRLMGFFYDFMILRFSLAYENYDIHEVPFSFLSREEVKSVRDGLKSGKLELMHVLDKYIPMFGATYNDLLALSTKATALDASLLLRANSLSRDLVATPDEINLRKYVLFLREAFLLKLVLLALASRVDRMWLMNVISRWFD